MVFLDVEAAEVGYCTLPSEIGLLLVDWTGISAVFRAYHGYLALPDRFLARAADGAAAAPRRYNWTRPLRARYLTLDPKDTDSDSRLKRLHEDQRPLADAYAESRAKNAECSLVAVCRRLVEWAGPRGARVVCKGKQDGKWILSLLRLWVTAAPTPSAKRAVQQLATALEPLFANVDPFFNRWVSGIEGSPCTLEAWYSLVAGPGRARPLPAHHPTGDAAMLCLSVAGLLARVRRASDPNLPLWDLCLAEDGSGWDNRHEWPRWVGPGAASWLGLLGLADVASVLAEFSTYSARCWPFEGPLAVRGSEQRLFARAAAFLVQILASRGVTCGELPLWQQLNLAAGLCSAFRYFDRQGQQQQQQQQQQPNTPSAYRPHWMAASPCFPLYTLSHKLRTDFERPTCMPLQS